MRVGGLRGGDLSIGWSTTARNRRTICHVPIRVSAETGREDEHEGAWMDGLRRHLNGWIDWHNMMVFKVIGGQWRCIEKIIEGKTRIVHTNLRKRFTKKNTLEYFGDSGSTKPTWF